MVLTCGGGYGEGEALAHGEAGDRVRAKSRVEDAMDNRVCDAVQLVDDGVAYSVVKSSASSDEIR